MKKITFVIKLSLILLLATACNVTDVPTTTSAMDYFPILENVHYIYQGEGNEYASFDVYIDYNDSNHIQQRINNGGSETVEVLAIEDNQVSLVYQQSEIYYRENFLARNEMNEVLLQDPIEVGTTWTVQDNLTRTITSIDTTVEAPDTNYSAVAVTTEGLDYQTIDYYVKDIGLVKTEYLAENMQVSSLLIGIENDVKMTETVNFYYPDIESDLYYYKSVDLEFSTNDITGAIMAAAYKDEHPEELGRVFSTNTQINEYYLMEEDVVNLDLNQEFLTEMNAGSGFEAMILQSIANTFGSYYMVNNVNLTIDGNLYESGHFAFMEGEYLTVDTINSLDISEYGNGAEVTSVASDYFPILDNIHYIYQGSGNEYASYDAYVDFFNEDSFQLRINNGGTEMIRVIKVEQNRITCVYEKGEVYYRENALNKTNTSQILLQGPIAVGTTWTVSSGVTSTITNGAIAVTTPSGNYTAIEVTTEYPDSTTHDYYVKDIGLVKSISTAENYEVTASLETIEEDTPLIQYINFYYPNINDDTIYYTSRAVSFNTNDITRFVFQNAYKEQIENQPGRVFSANTKINWYYLNRDGMAYIDLNQAFISEMNAGAGYEAMILRCVANTFGQYYGVSDVVLTIDGGLYESGHIALGRFEYLDVKTDDCKDLSTLVDSADSTAQSYFPILENTHYVYEGDGNEYAGYDVYVDYTNASKIQQRINNTGTEVVRVLNIEENRITVVYNQAETYYRENSLNKNNTSEILLQGPIEVGTSWQLSNGTTRTITSVSANVTTPSGSYNAIEVTNSAANYQNVDYYVEGIGLVKQVNTGEGYEVSSSLKTVEYDTPLVQNIRFFYPNINDDKIYFKTRNISFHTNDITRIVLQNAYKDVPAGVGPVFSTNTKINWYYLNRDGMVYIDLSQDYITEMNAGSGYEAMMLQCIANTFGSYYQNNRVLLTIDGGLYESGHIYLERFEYLTVNTEDSVAL